MAELYEHLVPKLCPGYDDALWLFGEISKSVGTVVDLGAGQGNVASAILEKNPKVKYLGVDIDQETLEKTTDRFQQEGYDFHSVAQDIRDYPIPQADIVVSSLTLHHLGPQEQESLLAGIHVASRRFLHFEYILPETEEEAQAFQAQLEAHIAQRAQELGIPQYELEVLLQKSKHVDYPLKLSDHERILNSHGATMEVLLQEMNFAFYISYANKW